MTPAARPGGAVPGLGGGWDPQVMRLPVIDRFLLAVARTTARRRFDEFLAATRRIVDVQQRTLLEKIRRNAESDFGREHLFASIRSYEDFTRRVPILRYEDLRPYIERVKRGETRAMFGGRQRVLMFALTSGTTGEPKYIPVTRAVLSECRRGWNVFGLKALLDHPGTFLRPILQISSRMDESVTPAGIPCGAITGLMAATQKRLVRRYYVSPLELAYVSDTTAKYYTAMRLAIPRDVAFLITASPATQLAMVRTADRYREPLIRDIHDGTLWADLPVEPGLRRRIEGRLRPDPATAARLEDLVRRHGALLPKHYWRLGFLANWTGGTMGLYLREFPRYFGDTPVRDIGLIASEGRMTIPLEDGTPAGVLCVNDHFFEFIPAGERESRRPVVLRAHELEAGGEYFILLTTSSGLYRYDIGDLVRVHGRYNEAPVLEFLNKGAHVASLAGEKLTEQQAILAMKAGSTALGLAVDTFVLAPRWDSPPYYVLHVEPPGGVLSGLWPGELARRLDQELCGVNIEYASKRRSGRLGPVRVNVLPCGFLSALDERIRRRHRAGNEQYKHQYLYVAPGADDEFPVASAPVPGNGLSLPGVAGVTRP